MVRFYCEHCEKEVQARDKVCPHCGKFFSQVRCPECNYQGAAEHFAYGCPQCSYKGNGKVETVYEDIDSADWHERPMYLRKSSGAFPDWLFAVVGLFIFAAFMIVAGIYFFSR